MKFKLLALTALLVLIAVGCSTVSIPPTTEPEPTATSISAQAWAPIPPLPTPRTAAAVAIADGSIYVMGGLDSLGRSSDKVEVFNPRDKSWTEAAPLPKTLQHAAAVTVTADGADRIYLFGGLSGRRGVVSDSVYVYEPRPDRWDERSPLPEARGALAATVYGESVYVVGGLGGDEVSSRIDVYHPTSDSWSTGPSLRSPRSHMKAVSIGSLIYVIGGKGEDGGASLVLTETLDPTKGAWAKVREMNMGRANLGALEHNGRLYILGGADIDAAWASTRIFDPRSAQWQTFQSLPTASQGAATAKVDGIAYFIGGSVGPGLSVVGDAYAIVLQ